MRKKYLLFLIIASFSLPSLGLEQKRAIPELPQNFKKWLDEEVGYIISKREKEVFLQLETDRERELFVEAFWRHRDPTLGTPGNEYRKEHYRRINYANRIFGRAASKRGWRTDRGRIYIILGEPRHISRFAGESQIYNSEIWFYQGLVKFGLPPGFNLVFYQRQGVGEYVLYSPSRDGPQALMPAYIGGQGDYLEAYKALKKIQPNLAYVSLSLIPGEPTFDGRPSLSSEIMIQNVYSAPQKQIKDQYATKFLMYKDIVEVEYTANYIDSDSLIKVIKDSSGMYFIHYVVELMKLSVNLYQGKYSTNLKVNVNVSDGRRKTIYQYEKSIPINFDESQIEKINYLPFNLYDMFPLIPGDYKLSILIKNEVSKEFSSVEKDISIHEDEFSIQMSPLILGYQMDRVPSGSNKLRPFMIGLNQIYCEPRKIFLSQDKLFLSFQILGLDPDLKQKGLLKFEFIKESEQFFSITRKVSEYKNQINFIEEFSLEKFPPAHYRIKVTLLDGNHEVLSGGEEFTVTFVSGLPRPWVHKKVLPPSIDPIYSLILGRQLFNKGEADKARIQLEKAYHSRPNVLDYALNLVQVYSIKEEHEKIKQILLPFSESPQANYEVYFFLGRALQALGELTQAVSFYNKAISRFGTNIYILNFLGECYYQKGLIKEALTAWEKSLDINPNQPEIKKIVDAIKE